MAEYIDREAIYRKACRGCTRHGDEFGICYLEEPCEALQAEFVSAPAADVAPVRHAHYEKGCCSNCGYPMANDCWGGGFDENIFCYHCGAKMDEKETEE